MGSDAQKFNAAQINAAQIPEKTDKARWCQAVGPLKKHYSRTVELLMGTHPRATEDQEQLVRSTPRFAHMSEYTGEKPEKVKGGCLTLSKQAYANITTNWYLGTEPWNRMGGLRCG